MTLSTKDLGYWYEDNRRLFENVNLTFEKGKMYAILGTSGSGKTTFFIPDCRTRYTKKRRNSL